MGRLRLQQAYLEASPVDFDAADGLAERPAARCDLRSECAAVLELRGARRQQLRIDDAVTRAAVDEARVAEQRLVEAEQRLHATDFVFVERTQHPPPRVLAIDAVHDE